MNIMHHVSISPTHKPVLGGRSGTAWISIAEFARRFGPHSAQWDDPDAKVKVVWTIDTPRGPCEVRDYWWNAENEMSIAVPCHDGDFGSMTYSARKARKASLWVRKWLRAHGVACE